MLFLESFVPQMECHLHSMKVEVEVVMGRVGFDEVGTYQSCYQPLSQRSADSAKGLIKTILILAGHMVLSQFNLVIVL